MNMAWIVALSLVVAGGPEAAAKPVPVPPAAGGGGLAADAPRGDPDRR